MERYELREAGFIEGYEFGYDQGLWDAFKNFTSMLWDPYTATKMDSKVRPLPQPDDGGFLVPYDTSLKLDKPPGEGELPEESTQEGSD